MTHFGLIDMTMGDEAISQLRLIDAGGTGEVYEVNFLGSKL